MPFEIIDLAKGSNIRHSLRRLAREESPPLSILHLAFSGDYRDGSDGKYDAQYIGGITRIACAVWRPSAMILDLAGMSYNAGQGIDDALEPPLDEPFVIIVSSLCEEGISEKCGRRAGLRTILDREDVFSAFDSALAYIREKVAEKWNARVQEHSLASHEAD